MPILSFKDERCARLVRGEAPGKGFPQDVTRRAFTKLLLVNAASALGDLLDPPGNRLEALSGDRVGQHSIRVNRQFRICFVWTPEGASEVELVDYH